MARFRGFHDFFGTYSGHYDGRNARLVISDVKADSVRPMCHITFTELDRNQTYVGNYIHEGKHDHILTNIVLKEKGGQGEVRWSRLHLHTWNTTYLSGVSIWNGIEFGMSFKKAG
jgi:hypothetical protein